jgi:hypothetical protein
MIIDSPQLDILKNEFFMAGHSLMPQRKAWTAGNSWAFGEAFRPAAGCKSVWPDDFSPSTSIDQMLKDGIAANDFKIFALFLISFIALTFFFGG